MRIAKSTRRRGSGSTVTLKRLSRKARALLVSPAPTTERGKRRAARREADQLAAVAASLEAAALHVNAEGDSVS